MSAEPLALVSTINTLLTEEDSGVMLSILRPRGPLDMGMADVALSPRTDAKGTLRRHELDHLEVAGIIRAWSFGLGLR